MISNFLNINENYIGLISAIGHPAFQDIGIGLQKTRIGRPLAANLYHTVLTL